MIARSLKFTFAGLAVLTLATAVFADGKTPPPTAEDGKRIYMEKKNKCVTCHGEDGKAQTKMGQKKQIPDMTTAKWQKSFTDQQIKESILKGVDRMDGDRKVIMKPLDGATERDAQAILAFIRSLGPKK